MREEENRSVVRGRLVVLVVPALLALAAVAAAEEAKPDAGSDQREPLSRHPEPIGKCEAPLSQYPADLVRQGVEGDVLLRVDFDETGRILLVKAEQSVDPELARLSVDWVKTQCRFTGARGEFGEPVAMILLVKFKWRIDRERLGPGASPGLIAPEITERALVKLKAPPGVGLHATADGRKLCESPCLRVLPRHVAFYVDGPEIVRSSSFALRSNERDKWALIEVIKPGSLQGRAISAGAIATGVAALLASVALVVDANRRDDRYAMQGMPLLGASETDRHTALGLGVSGGVALVAGLVGVVLTRTRLWIGD